MVSNKNLVKMDSIAILGKDNLFFKKAGMIFDKYFLLDVPPGYASSISSYMDKTSDSLVNFLSALFQLSRETVKAAEIDNILVTGAPYFTSTLRFSSYSLPRVEPSIAILYAMISKGDIWVDKKFLKREKIPYELEFRDLTDLPTENSIKEDNITEAEYRCFKLIKGGMAQRHPLSFLIGTETTSLYGIYKEIGGTREFYIETPPSEYARKEVIKKLLELDPKSRKFIPTDTISSLDKIEIYDGIGVISHLFDRGDIRIQNVFIDGVILQVQPNKFVFEAGKTRMKLEKDNIVKTLELPPFMGTGMGMSELEELRLFGHEPEKEPRIAV